MRVLKSSEEPDLPQEALAADRVGDFGTQDFERDASMVLLLLGEVHLAHAALT